MAEGNYNQFCPIAMASEILCTRWTLLVLRELLAGSTRFNELRRGVQRMSPALLSKRLKELEAAGIVTRSKVRGGPELFEYQLTKAGRELAPVIDGVGAWGHRWIKAVTTLLDGGKMESCGIGDRLKELRMVHVIVGPGNGRMLASE